MGYVWSPLAPSRSGVAGYCEALICGDPAFGDVTFVTEDPAQRAGRRAVAPDGEVWNEDRALLELGNHRDHGYVLERARMGGAVVELHELSLHPLHARTTLGRNDFPAYLCGLQGAEGDWGRRAAYQRVKGSTSHRLEAYMRVNREICERARAVIVHSDWARFQVEVQGVATPVNVVPRHAPGPAAGTAGSREETRERLGLDPDRFTVLVAGPSTARDRADWVLDAFETTRDEGADIALVVAGPCADEALPDRIAASRHRGAIHQAPAAAGTALDDCLMAADAVGALEFPSLGASSDLVARALGFGRVAMVADYAAYSDLPDDACAKVRLDRPVADQIAGLLAELSTEPGLRIAIEERARAHAREHLALEGCRRKLRAVLDRYWH